MTAEEKVRAAVDTQMQIREHFIAQYLSRTGADIRGLQLVEQRDGNTIRFWIEEKS